jgi:hypothetical protein
MHGLSHTDGSKESGEEQADALVPGMIIGKVSKK